MRRVVHRLITITMLLFISFMGKLFLFTYESDLKVWLPGLF